MRHELPATFSEFREVFGHQLDFSANGVSYDIDYLIAGNISKARLQLCCMDERIVLVFWRIAGAKPSAPFSRYAVPAGDVSPFRFACYLNYVPPLCQRCLSSEGGC